MPTKIALDYQYIPAKKTTKRTLLLLHGYQLTGRSMIRWIKPALESSGLVEKFNILAPCGPYPVPKKRGRSYRIGYSWYFYDPYRDLYFIGPEMAVDLLGQLLLSLRQQNHSLYLVGYSQGGYLSPFLSQSLPQTRTVIGVACRFLPDELSGKVSDSIKNKKNSSYTFSRTNSGSLSRASSLNWGRLPSLHSIHGKLDEILPWKESQHSFEGAKKYFQKKESTFTLFPQETHQPSQRFAHHVCHLLQTILQKEL